MAVVVTKLLNNLCEYPSNICIRCIRIDFPPSEQIKSANADADLEELRTDTDQILADTGRILQIASSARIWIICLSHCQACFLFAYVPGILRPPEPAEAPWRYKSPLP